MLSMYANINLSESLLLADFEREAYINMLAMEMEKDNNIKKII